LFGAVSQLMLPSYRSE